MPKIKCAKKALFAAAILATGSGAFAQPGYLMSAGTDQVVRNAYGECWHTGSFTPDMAIVGCDGKLPQATQVSTAVEVMKPAPAPVTPEPVGVDTTTYFGFDKATLRPDAVDTLDSLIATLRESEGVDDIVVTGYTDRIGPASYNQKLSEERAESVRNYLVEHSSLTGRRITTVGKGESDPVVTCEDQGFKALVKCLQPNRRVEVTATATTNE